MNFIIVISEIGRRILFREVRHYDVYRRWGIIVFLKLFRGELEIKNIEGMKRIKKSRSKKL